jgi:2'-5' RNA ligase
VLWGGVTVGAEPLQRLYSALEEEMLELGCYRTEERGYTPHLTLGRVNTAEAGFALAPELPKRMAWPGGHTGVEEVLVYSSELDDAGPVYTVIGRAPLTGK